MTSIPYASPPPVPVLPFKDRRASLTAVGILCIVVGAGAGCLTAMMPLSLFMPQAAGEPPMSLREFVPAALTFLAGTILFLGLGLGAIRARRWARPVLLALSWSWLLYGILFCAFWMLFAPDLAQLTAPPNTGGAGGPPPAAGVLVEAVIVGALFSFALLVLLPALLIWLLAPADVRSTAAYFSPPSWTDERPIPVLTVGLWPALAASSLLYECAFPSFSLFGHLLLGAAGAVALVACAAVCCLLAVRFVQRRPDAWWGVLALLLFWVASSVVTAIRIDPIDVYRRAGHSQAEIESVIAMNGLTRASVITGNTAFGLVGLAGLLYTRRYFGRPVLPAPPLDT